MRTPALLLLDEPTNGMDPAGIREFPRLLRSLADAGTTVFLSSHLLAEVEQVCDRVAVLNRGRLIEEGRVSELTSHASEFASFSRRRIDTGAHAARRVATTTDGANALLIDGARGRDVSEVFGRAGVWAHEIPVEHADLEDAFLHLTADDRPGPPVRRTTNGRCPGATRPRWSYQNQSAALVECRAHISSVLRPARGSGANSAQQGRQGRIGSSRDMRRRWDSRRAVCAREQALERAEDRARAEPRRIERCSRRRTTGTGSRRAPKPRV